MSVNLFDLAGRFPAQMAQAPSSPARILETEFRLMLRRKLGNFQASLDLARPRVPDRLGVGLRPYEPGDALRSLSRVHLMRTGELLTRTDFAAGRQRARILLIHEESMSYRSPEARANKGQVALAIAALLECAHAGWGHGVSFHVVSGLANIGLALRPRDTHVYVIADVLHPREGVDRAGGELLAQLQARGVRGALAWVVRDPWEHPEGNPLGALGARLVSQEADSARFSGADYLRNLNRQWESFRSRALLDGHRPALASGSCTLESVVDELCQCAGARRRG